MTATRELSGEWWLPGAPERRVPGVLRLEQDKTAILTLIGEMRAMWDDASRAAGDDKTSTLTLTESAWTRSGQYPRVHGQVGVKAYTLDGGLRARHNRNLMGGLPSESITFAQIFTDVYMDADEALTFDRAAASLQGLTQWVGRSGIAEEHEFAIGGGARQLRLKAEPLSERKVRLGDGLALHLTHEVSLGGDFAGLRGFGDRFAVQVRSTSLRPLEELMATLSRLQALVSIGTARVAGFERVTLSRPDVYRKSVGRRRVRQPIEYIASWSARDRRDKPLRPSDVTFTLEHLGGMAALARWLEIARRYHHQLDQVMATRYRDGLVSDRLYNCVAATEGFHKLAIGPRQGKSLGKRLLECVDLAGDDFADLVTDVTAWVAAIVAARNRIGHGDQAGAFEAGRTYYLAQSMYWLFVLCLLRQAKVRPAVLARIVASSEWTWLKENLAEG